MCCPCMHGARFCFVLLSAGLLVAEHSLPCQHKLAPTTFVAGHFALLLHTTSRPVSSCVAVARFLILPNTLHAPSLFHQQSALCQQSRWVEACNLWLGLAYTARASGRLEAFCAHPKQLASMHYACRMAFFMAEWAAWVPVGGTEVAHLTAEWQQYHAVTRGSLHSSTGVRAALGCL